MSFGVNIQRKRRSIIFAGPAIIFFVLGCILGFKPLSDLDLGWHLAGGLWMLNFGQIPKSDPFGAEGRTWWCYSWLFEYVIAIIFRYFSFAGLRVFQAITVGAVVASMWVSVSANRVGNASHFRKGFAYSVVGASVGTLLVSPIFHLRPQLLSVFFLLWLLRWLQQDRANFFAIVVLTIVWANIHVFWIFAPLTYFLMTSLPSKQLGCSEFWPIVWKSFLLVLCGLCNPYGIQMFTGLYEYAFAHERGYKLIQEFQPLGLRHGAIFWVMGVASVYSLIGIRKISQSLGLGFTLLLFVLLCAAWTQVKYVPIFGVFLGSAIAAVHASQHLFSTDVPAKDVHTPMTRRDQRLLAASFVTFCVVAWLTNSSSVLVRPSLTGLVELAQVATPHCAKNTSVILNHFDDGGWLNLGLALRAEKTGDWHALKSSVDGRSLVMGAERLKDFQSLRLGAEDVWSILKRWKVDIAILRKDRKFLQRDLIQNSQHWQIAAENEYYVLLYRNCNDGGNYQLSTPPT